jgi:uncharacterized protein YbjT (DUF2867 family)
MILVLGATGRLGGRLVPRLVARGLSVRILTRNAERARAVPGVEVAVGDLRDPATLLPALTGVRTLVAAAQGFGGVDAQGVRAVDLEGNIRLIDAALAAGVEHIVLLSIHGAAEDHPLRLLRAKAVAETHLRASGIAWTIVRPTVYAETWLDLIGRPLIETGRTRIFGEGRNPIDFVSVGDVAAVTETAVVDPTLRGATIPLAGPAPVTMLDLVELVREVTGVAGRVSRVPRPMLRIMAAALRDVRPVMADQVATALAMDTQPMVASDAARARPDPQHPITSLREVATGAFAGTRSVSDLPLGRSEPTG